MEVRPLGPGCGRCMDARPISCRGMKYGCGKQYYRRSRRRAARDQDPAPDEVAVKRCSIPSRRQRPAICILSLNRLYNITLNPSRWSGAALCGGKGSAPIRSTFLLRVGSTLAGARGVLEQQVFDRGAFSRAFPMEVGGGKGYRAISTLSRHGRQRAQRRLLGAGRLRLFRS